MRTNIDIDDKIMAEAMKAGGFATKREAVETALRMFAQRKQAYADLLALGGKIDWDGDLDDWRTSMQRAQLNPGGARHAVAEPAPFAFAPTPRPPRKSAGKPARKSAPRSK